MGAGKRLVSIKPRFSPFQQNKIIHIRIIHSCNSNRLKNNPQIVGLVYKRGFTVVGSLVKRKPFWGFFREAWINLFWKFLKSVKSRVEKAYLNVSLKFLNWPKFNLRTKTKLPKTRNRAIVIWNSSLSKIWNLTTLRKALVGCSFLIPGADKQDYEYRTSLAHIFNQIELFQF